jgi:hypothetical protein
MSACEHTVDVAGGAFHGGSAGVGPGHTGGFPLDDPPLELELVDPPEDDDDVLPPLDDEDDEDDDDVPPSFFFVAPASPLVGVPPSSVGTSSVFTMVCVHAASARPERETAPASALSRRRFIGYFLRGSKARDAVTRG